jgi:hypothetical protein
MGQDWLVKPHVFVGRILIEHQLSAFRAAVSFSSRSSRNVAMLYVVGPKGEVRIWDSREEM